MHVPALYSISAVYVGEVLIININSDYFLVLQVFATVYIKQLLWSRI